MPSDVSVLKEKLWNGNNVILVSHYNDKGNLSGGADNVYYFGLSVGDTIQFYENGVPTEAFTVIAKAAVTSNEMALTGGGSNIATDIGGPKIYICLLYTSNPSSPKYIQTVKGIGYRFNKEV